MELLSKQHPANFSPSKKNPAFPGEKSLPFFQPKLTINQPHDVYEQEADAMADKVMRMPDRSASDQAFFKPAVSFIQRKCAHCEKEEQQLQRKEANSSAIAADYQLDGYVNGLSGGGQSLSKEAQSFFEPRFGRDFSNVKVHTDAVAAKSAQSINALAYTSGSNIVFNSGQYSPDTDSGKRLLGHELTHVVQQSPAQARSSGQSSSMPATGCNIHPSTGIQRKCGSSNLGAPAPECTPSDAGSVGWQLLFKVGCDELLPGEEKILTKLKKGATLKIHGFASKEGTAAFNDQLSCHRANRIAELVRTKRTDCSVAETLKHGASPATAPGLVPDPNPPGFWQSVIIEEAKPAPAKEQPSKAACATVPTATPSDCEGRHLAYAAAAKCFPLNSWLPCVKVASKEVCRAVEAFNFRGAEGADLEKCVFVTGGSKKFTLEKGAWFNNTNACIWGHWRNAMEAVNDPSAPVPSNLTTEWGQAVTTCRKEGVGSSACCEAHVIAEQSAIDTCEPYDSLVFGKLPTDVPGSGTCSDIIKLASLKSLPFTGDFGDLKDRINYGLFRCCSGL